MYKSAKKCAYHLLISKSLFKKLITPAMFECKTRLIAHSKAREKLVIMMKFHRFKRICFCVNRKKLFCVGVKFFSNFFFKNVLGTTWGSFTQNFSQIHYVYLYRRGHPSRDSMNEKYRSKQTNFERTWMSEKPGWFVST